MPVEQIYNIVKRAIATHASLAVVPSGTTEEDVRIAAREVMRDNPGIFWFSHQWTFDKDTSHIHLRYTLSTDRTLKASKSIDDVVENDFFQGGKDVMMTLPEARRVAYVYKWIAGYCRYNVHSAYNQTIYSVFVYRNSVCTGIAKATQYLLKLLGEESHLVFGRLHNSDSTSRHCWLMVKVDGKWYHHDPTFALLSLSGLLRHSGEDKIISDGRVVYNCFLVSTEVIQRTRTIEEADTLPLCTDCLSDKGLLNVEFKLLREPMENGSYRGCLLASGSTSDIYQHKAGYVVKVFHHDVEAKLLVHEREIMSRLKGCKHLLQMDDACNDSGGIVIEQGTPLLDLMRSHYFKLTGQGLCMLLKEVVYGLLECREKGAFYRDIHPANIYMTADGSYKLGDFGSCYIQGQSPCDEGGLASKWFMAPETYKKGIFDERSQVYMVAMVAYYLLNNSRPPFWDEYRERAFEARMSGRPIPMPAKLSKLSGTFADSFTSFFTQALSFEPVHRYNSLVELLRAIEDLRELTIDRIEKPTIDHIEGDECAYDSNEGGSSGHAYVIPGDNPLLVGDGSDNELTDGIREYSTTCAIPDPGTNSPMPDFYSTCEWDDGVLVSDGGESETDFIGDASESIDDPVDEIELHMADLYKTAEPFCRTMGGVEQEGDIAWFDLLQCTEDSAEPVGNTPAPQCCRPSHEPLPQSHPSKSPECTYEPIVPENLPASIPRVSVLIGNIVSTLIGSIFSFCAIPFRKKTRNDDVYSSVFGPAEVKRGTNMLVQVFLHTANNEEKVQIIASQADENTARRGYTPLSCKMKKGDKADVELNIYDKGLIKNERKSIIWNSEYTQCSFRYFVDENIEAGNLYCEVNVYVNGVPVGCTSFLTDIVAHEARNIYAKQDAKRFERIFVSYSHQDYDRVKYLVQGFRAQGIDYFFDRHNLRSGDVYSERIFAYIDKADLFMLCWSANARKSEYVKKEIERALSHVYPQVTRDSETLKIRPISIEPRADFPPSIRDIYHFEEL